MKGFNPEYPHQDLKNFKTYSLNLVESGHSIPSNTDFYTEDYGDHDRCLDLVQKSKFTWCCQDYSKYDKTMFKTDDEYLSYLDPNLDGTTLEAIFSGSIPILHKFNKKAEIIKEFPELRYCCLFYNPEIGYNNLYRQYKDLDIEYSLECLSRIKDFYAYNKSLFYNKLISSLKT
jgi:hypothetical protein